MALRFRRIRLRAETGVGVFGADVPFSNGLNVLWADNTMGKSTTLQAILYGLGLERMLSARREIPLTYVMTSHLIDPESGARQTVLESSVALEVENGKGEIITIRRGVVGANLKLVSVFDGPLLSDPGSSYRQRDFFVLDPGAAQRDAGFHRFLAEFMEWKLPTVRRFDGSEVPLYLETIFPLLYVEQKAGWSSMPAAIPTYFQIRDVTKRAVEFLLGLETHEVELRRQQIDFEFAALRAAWTAKLQQLTVRTRPLNARLIGLPATPIISSDELDGVSLEVLHAGAWVPLSKAIEELEITIAQRQAEVVPTVGEVAPAMAEAYEEITKHVDELNGRRVVLLREQRIEASQLTAAQRRIATLEEDLQKNLDVLKLRKLGSAIGPSLLVPDRCPTCDQPIEDTLLPQSHLGDVMPIEDNVEYVRTQLNMFRQVASQAATEVENIGLQVNSISSELRDASVRLRAMRTDLAASETSPSAAAIAERLQLENRLAVLTSIGEEVESEKLSFGEMSSTARRLLEEKAALPADRFSSGDKAKLARLSDLVRSQAEEYGFTTFDSSEIAISEDSYRPEKEGFEIGFQLSASDAIRLKWAYQLALLELGRSVHTNHPGFVIFDEPRQQEARRMSFKSLLEHASSSLEANEQVIFATSEDFNELRGYLEGIRCNVIAFDGRMVKRVSA